MAGLVLCVVAAGAFYFLSSRPESAVLPAPRHHVADTGAASREASASALLTRLVDGLRSGDAGRVLALATPGVPRSRAELGDLFHNVRALGVDHLSMRYVDEQSGRLSPAAERRLGGRAWVADVQLGWRDQGFDRGTSHQEVTLTLADTPHGARFVTARPGYGDPAPLWLLTRLRVARTTHSLVVAAAGQDLGRFSRMADRAVTVVQQVLSHWRGRLVVEVPASQSQLDRTLGANRNDYNEIAAVTTTVDGSTNASAPVHIFVNPPVFDPLGPNGAQIVLSHEATHVATHAATSSMPTWLLEGFADFVALDHVDLPVSVTASQILGTVRKSGPPSHLPTAAEFGPSNTALGEEYEAAWLACRLIGQTYGQQKLIDFYLQADRDGSTDRAFPDVLGTSQAAFTRAWQGYLRRLS